MWISRFRIQAFSSFKDSGWIELDPSMNLFIGANNSGKSALLKALKFPLAPNPHRDAEIFRGIDVPTPKLEVDLKATIREIFERFSRMQQNPVFPFGGANAVNRSDMGDLIKDFDNAVTLEFGRLPDRPTYPRDGASLSDFRVGAGQIVVQLTKIGDKILIGDAHAGTDTLSRLFSEERPQSCFYFDAQRLNVGKAPFDGGRILNSNASNLASVLAFLQGAQRPLFDKIEKIVIQTMGGIGRITVKPDNGHFEILISPDRDALYEELNFGLDDCGTGVGQLLAIATAMVITEQSVFLIDEINTFLHPNAVKAFLSIIRSEFSQHQYIITTHSPEVISASRAERIYSVVREGFNSRVEEISIMDAEQVRHISGLLGFSMMDVFGHERMIWVEGPTEEICFPILANEYGLLRDDSVGFAPVFSTSGFSEKRGAANAATNVYELAGKRLSPLIKGMAFALDRETLSDDEVATLERSKKKLRFLPRRCLECYLINPHQISAYLTDLDGIEHSIDSVERAIQSVGGEIKFGAPSQWDNDITNEAWLKKVDGAKVLSHIFSSLTEHRFEYRKTRDTPMLLKRTIQLQPHNLDGLISFLKKVVEIAYRDTPP